MNCSSFVARLFIRRFCWDMPPSIERLLGKNPWIRISVNKTAIADVQNEGVTIFPGSPQSAHCVVKFGYLSGISSSSDTDIGDQI